MEGRRSCDNAAHRGAVQRAALDKGAHLPQRPERGVVRVVHEDENGRREPRPRLVPSLQQRHERRPLRAVHRLQRVEQHGEGAAAQTAALRQQRQLVCQCLAPQLRICGDVVPQQLARREARLAAAPSAGRLPSCGTPATLSPLPAPPAAPRHPLERGGDTRPPTAMCEPR